LSFFEGLTDFGRRGSRKGAKKQKVWGEKRRSWASKGGCWERTGGDWRGVVERGLEGALSKEQEIRAEDQGKTV